MRVHNPFLSMSRVRYSIIHARNVLKVAQHYDIANFVPQLVLLCRSICSAQIVSDP